MKALRFTSAYKKDVKRCRRRGYDLDLLHGVVDLLATPRMLPAAHRDHPLKGVWKGRRECHVQPDWLLVYEATEHELVLVRTGTHADLFQT